MKSIFRATAILSAGSMITVVVGMVTAKVLVLVLQPVGYGYYGLLQSFVGVTTLFAGLGMATGWVRLGARAATQNDHAVLAGLRSGAWLLFAGLSGITLLVLTIFRTALSRLALGNSDHGWTIVLMAFAILFTVAGNIQMGTLNAYHRVGALAKYAVANTIGSGLLTIGAVLIWHAQGIVPAVVAGGVVGWVASGYYLRREIKVVHVRPSRKETLQSAWALARFGGPFCLSMAVGTGVQLALPMVVVHLLNPASVGYYKAASAISVGYLGFLVAAMGQDYYPRISAVAHQPGALVKLINEQHRLVMLIGVPIILGMLAIVPVFIPIVYSRKFMPAAAILEWQLIGDIFKFSAWTMSWAVLARCKSYVYFITESIGGATMVVFTWLGVRWFGLAGLGISFLASYIIYYLVVWSVVRREVPLVWTASNKKMILGALAAAFIIRILPSTRLAAYRTPVALALALGAGIPSLFIMWREFMHDGAPVPTEIPIETPPKAVEV